jgi:hypothetical protein
MRNFDLQRNSDSLVLRSQLFDRSRSLDEKDDERASHGCGQRSQRIKNRLTP